MKNQLLNILCNPEDPRDHIKSAWYENGFSYSTNGCCCLRIPGNFGEKGGKDFPKASEFNWGCLVDESLVTYIDPLNVRKNSKPCTNCRVDISEPTTGRCPQCGGSGETTCWHCNSEIECEDCDGTGIETTVVPRKDCDDCLGTGVKQSKYRIHNQKLNTMMLLLLLENLPNLRFLIGKEVVKNSIGFRFGTDGMGVLMTMRD